MTLIEDCFDIRMLCAEEGIVIHADEDETKMHGNFAADVDSLATIEGNTHA